MPFHKTINNVPTPIKIHPIIDFAVNFSCTVMNWVKKYLAEGEGGLEQKKKPGNPLSRYERRKELTYEEQLQYQIELLKRELVKKEAEVLRLKKLNGRKGGGAQRK